MSQNLHVGIVGAGIVGLSAALWLQKKGCKVTLIDKGEPGTGTSFGSAGLFADYACLPFARFATMFQIPSKLMDRKSPLSIQGKYMPALIPYGWRFFKACFPANFVRAKQALKNLQAHADKASQILLNETGAQNLVKSQGCLGLFSSQEGFDAAKTGDLSERRGQGVNLEFLSADEVRELEPDIANFHSGGVFYPDTRFTISPGALCRQYAEHFVSNGGVIIQDEVCAIASSVDGVQVSLSSQSSRFDHLVVAAGVASKSLLANLNVNIPLVSERGYHLVLEANEKVLNRPVGWLDNSVYLTPMADGIRMAGIAEFANVDAPLSQAVTKNMSVHAERMLGVSPMIKSTWVGSRPSTPDSLPVIGTPKGFPKITLALGHGHLGLTFGGVTGELVAQNILGQRTSIALNAFSPDRFSS